MGVGKAVKDACYYLSLVLQHHLHVPDTEHNSVASGPEEPQNTKGVWGVLQFKI